MLKLSIGNKNSSSWSLRPWVLLKQAGIPFETVMVRFDAFDADSTFKRAIESVNPAGRVPVLIDGDLTGWDALAIAESVAEKFPEAKLWPAGVAADIPLYRIDLRAIGGGGLDHRRIGRRGPLRC